jgi:hypothetical protein
MARLGLDLEAGALFIDRARTIGSFSGLARVHLTHVMRLSPLEQEPC